MRKNALSVTLAALTLAACGSAKAGVVFTAGPGNVAGDQNILFNGLSLAAGPATLVQGRTNQSSSVIDFFNAGETLTTPSGGQARVAAVDGQLTQLKIAPHDSTQSFTSYIFNLDAAKDGSVTLSVQPTIGVVVSQTFSVGKNGQNFFRVTTDGGTSFSSLSLSSTVGLSDVSQNRAGVVPEPASLTLAGLAGLGLLTRRRRTR